MTLADELIAKADQRDLLFGIIGLGYVGLPLAVELIKAGYRVLGFDVDSKVVAGLERGESHVKDVSHEDLQQARADDRLRATTDMSRLREPDVISICVPTPLSKFKDPDMSYIQSAGRALTKTLRAGQIVILESTTYPGTTREILLPELESSGLSVGTDFFLAFSPERVDPGNTTYQTRNTPKVVGGITPDCLRVAMACYQPAIDTLVPVSTTEAAELVKLLENTFRSVNIGLANEMAIVCDKLGVDVWEVIDAAATKPFGFMRFLPGPGLGGHCIPIDPHYLAWKMRGLNYKTRFVDLAGEVNTEMPLFWIRKVTDQLNIQSKSVRGANVLVLGVAYKRDVEDIRESPALDIINLLEGQGAEVRYHDPNVPELNHDGKVYRSVTLTPDEVRHADCVIIVTDHTNVDYDMVRQNAKSVVDTRNVLRRTSSTSP